MSAPVRALNALAGVICQAQNNGRVTPMGIAHAVDAAGLHMYPETAAEHERLRVALHRIAGFCTLPGCGEDCPSVAARHALAHTDGGEAS